MKKLLTLIPCIFLMACTDIGIIFGEPTSTSNPSSTSETETTSSTTLPTSTTSLEEDTLNSTSTTSSDMNSTSTNSNSSGTTMMDETTSDTELTGMPIPNDSCNVLDPSSCETGHMCIALNSDEKGQCVLPCTGRCPDGLICQDWTALSNPQLPSGTGVCLPRKPCTLIAGDLSDCFATETCIGNGDPDWIGVCAVTCVNNDCGGKGVCTQWDKVSKPPLPEKVGVCL